MFKTKTMNLNGKNEHDKKTFKTYEDAKNYLKGKKYTIDYGNVLISPVKNKKAKIEKLPDKKI